MRSITLATIAALSACAASSAQSVPSSIYTDPPADSAHPAKMSVIHVPSHGVSINGVVYQPSGAGPHPTLVLCHGLPGNEKNLDLAQVVRRAGWNAVTFNYRGSWGSPGAFHFTQNLEDAAAVLAWLRDPANAAKVGVDTQRMVLAGHSMGGWVTVHTAAHDSGLIGAILISAWDAGRSSGPREKIVAQMADDMESLAGTTPEKMADELISHSAAFKFANAAEGLSHLPLLALTSDDGLAPHTDDLVKAIEAKGGHNVKTIHAATDHGWSDHRVALESAVVTWLAGLH
jgi:pimeloyl-ACP methyl ester carboxylesterase